MQKSVLNNSLYERLVFSCILLAPFLSNYVFFGQISVGDFLIFLVTPWFIAKLKITLTVAVVFSIFLLFVFVNFYFAFEYVGDLKLWRLIFFYTMFYFVLNLRFFNWQDYFSMYLIACVFFSLSIIFQSFIYYVFGVSIPFQFPILYYEPDTLKVIDHVYRSGGFFKEPSYFMIFVLPSFFYLFANKKFILLSFISLAGVLSTSSLFFFVFLLAFFSSYPLSFLFFSFFSVIIYFVFVLLGVVFGGGIFFDRVISIFKDGGTLNDRFLPVFSMLDKSGLFFDSAAYDFLLSGECWFSSVSSLLAGVGLLGITLLFVLFLRVGFLFAFIMFFLVLTTHIMSGVYSTFIAFTLFSLYRLSKFNLRINRYV